MCIRDRYIPRDFARLIIKRECFKVTRNRRTRTRSDRSQIIPSLSFSFFSSSLFLLLLLLFTLTHIKAYNMFDDDHPRAILIKQQQSQHQHHSLVDYQVLKKRLKECKQANVDLAREISKVVITFRSSLSRIFYEASF